MATRLEKKTPHLILDIGGVLVDHDDMLLADRLVRLLGGANRTTILSAFRESGLSAGRRRPEDVYVELAQRLGAVADVTAFRHVWSSHFTPNEGMIAFAREYASRAPLALCSNTDPVHWDFVSAHFGLDKLGPAVLSHECGFLKPDPEIYLLAAQAHDAAPQECLFVDDKPAYVDGARAVGMQAHLFLGLDGLMTALNTGA